MVQLLQQGLSDQAHAVVALQRKLLQPVVCLCLFMAVRLSTVYRVGWDGVVLVALLDTRSRVKCCRQHPRHSRCHSAWRFLLRQCGWRAGRWPHEQPAAGGVSEQCNWRPGSRGCFIGPVCMVGCRCCSLHTLHSRHLVSVVEMLL
jgi:hypothetical protein